MNENGDRTDTEPKQSITAVDTGKTVRRRRIRHLLLPLFLVTITALTAYNTLALNAAFSGNFPGSTLINISATYSFGSAPGSQTLSAGSTGNLTLNIYYAGSQPTTLHVSFNATDPIDWSGNCVTTSCSGIVSRNLSMTIEGQLISPINTDLNTVNYATSATVSIVHGQNNIPGQISVSPSDSNLGSFVLMWFASA